MWEGEGVWKIGVPVGKTGVVYQTNISKVKIWGTLLPWVADSRLPHGDLSKFGRKGVPGQVLKNIILARLIEERIWREAGRGIWRGRTPATAGMDRTTAGTGRGCGGAADGERPVDQIVEGQHALHTAEVNGRVWRALGRPLRGFKAKGTVL